MTARSWSLRRRLLAWLLVPLSLLAIGMVAATYVSAVESTNRAYDRILLASALAIAERVVLEDGEIDVDLPYVALEMLSSSAQDRVFYQVKDGEGQIVTGYRDLPGEVIPVDDAPLFIDAIYRDFAVRVATLTRPVRGRRSVERFTVKVAQTTSERSRLVREIVVRSGLGLAVVLLLVGVITWIGITRGLAPLERLRTAIRRRSSGDLSPLGTDVPREVDALVGSINGLMARLEESLAAMRRFIANASHQLRTPLAGLRTQTEVMMRRTGGQVDLEALQDLHGVTLRASRLADQLLAMARAEPGAGNQAAEPVDLAGLAREVTSVRVPRALEKSVDLGFDGPEQATLVQGDPTMLGEMLANVIDNAIVYAPAATRVTVRVDGASDDVVMVEVEDNGAGIPPDERERVFDRFYRPAGSPAGGCGLGLAIVREVAERHSGSVKLTDGPEGNGLKVVIQVQR